MTCFVNTPTFRLLDSGSGWEAESTRGIVVDDVGLSLALSGRGPGSHHRSSVDSCIAPSWLGKASSGNVCSAMEVERAFLVHSGRLLVLDPCRLQFEPIPELCSIEATAVAVQGRMVAVVDQLTGSIVVLDDGGRRIIANLPIRRRYGVQPMCVGFAGGDDLIVALAGAGGETVLVELSVLGHEIAKMVIATDDNVVGIGSIGSMNDRALFAVTAVDDEWRQLWRLPSTSLNGRTCNTAHLTRHRICAASVERISCAGCESGIVTTAAGFCLTLGGETRCFDHSGGPLPSELHADQPPRERDGVLLTSAIDSGRADAKWGRVVVDADSPAGTSVGVEVTVVDDPDAPVDPVFWERLGGSAALVQRQPRGRYLRLRIVLGGNGVQTPVVRGVRLDIDLPSGLRSLPAVYGEDPVAASFTERFLALFDLAVERLDDAVAAAPAFFDPTALRDEMLPYLAGALGVEVDPRWTPAQLRSLLQVMGRLRRDHGKPAGVIGAVRAVYGVDVVVDEAGTERPWDVVGRAQVGRVRLYVRSRRAVQLDASSLGQSPIDRFADLDAGAFSSGAFQTTVMVPWNPTFEDRATRASVERLIGRWAPAHLDVVVRFASGRTVFGPSARLGIDTTLGGLSGAVLRGRGDASCRLGRSAIVRSRRFAGSPMVLGVRSSVGVNTTVG